jgi:hypothetical protein
MSVIEDKGQDWPMLHPATMLIDRLDQEGMDALSVLRLFRACGPLLIHKVRVQRERLLREVETFRRWAQIGGDPLDVMRERALDAEAWRKTFEASTRALNVLTMWGIASEAECRLLGEDWFIRAPLCGRKTVEEIAALIGGWI